MKHLKFFENADDELLKLINKKIMILGNKDEDQTKLEFNQIYRLVNSSNVNIEYNEGKTALIWATERSDNIVKGSELMKKCIELGADVNHKDDKGRTALYLAIWKSDRKKTKILLDAGAELYCVDKFGFDAFFRSHSINIESFVKERYPEQYSEYLIKKRADKYNL